MFHLYKYIVLSEFFPTSFRKFLKERFLGKVAPVKASHLVNGEGNAAAECRRLNETIEYRIPLALLEKYSNVTHPKADVIWRANFYKTASNSSNPHWITWSFIDNISPSFHLPQFFGILEFK